MVQAGKTQVRVQLATDAKFELRFNNLSLAQEGDPVSVAGFYQPPDETKVKADRITITTDRVYGEPEEQTPKRRGRRSRDEEGDAAAEAEGEKAEGEEAGQQAAEKEAEAGAEAN